MRPADVCGCWTNPSSSSRARMLRTVADDTPRPAAVTSTDEATGSPAAMYSRTSVASTSLDRSWGSISTRRMRLLKRLYSRELPSRALEQLADGRTSRADDFGAIQVNRLPIVHQHLSVDNRRPHVGARRAIDER